ncbi:MAG: alpha/beta hydrolase [Rikenellaceae bacterium]|nr:alpha/beta hydrolase [Rikenellaceae bacterium]
MKRKTLAVLVMLLCCNLCGARISAVDGLQQWLALPDAERGDVATKSFARMALSRDEAERALKLIADDWWLSRLEYFSAIWQQRTITRDSHVMRFKYRIFGEQPAGSRSLYISMHGGGGTTAAVNDSQWANQLRLYSPTEGIVVAPRAPEDAWNMWFLPYIDGMFEELIVSAVAVMGVDPDKVYITGYSAGGDGVFRLASRMAHRWAAALMCAGHPGNTTPLSLRNVPFGLWVGANDTAYDRNVMAERWRSWLQELQRTDPTGYVYDAAMPETGHWMDRADTAAFGRLAAFSRNPLPDKVVWAQDSTDTNGALYWLSAPEHKVRQGGVIVARREGNSFTIEQSYCDEIIIGLNDRMINFDQPVSVWFDGQCVFRKKLKRTVAALYASFHQRNDEAFGFSATAKVKLK